MEFRSHKHAPEMGQVFNLAECSLGHGCVFLVKLFSIIKIHASVMYCEQVISELSSQKRLFVAELNNSPAFIKIPLSM
ncbi:MAG: hypothetical protein Q8P40_02270 [Nitrospirota bacterium]|nr:hypothetical protein [Nitrospirota bacterium]